jgi:hypothetical protein
VSQEHLRVADPRIASALNELAELVRRSYPDAEFQVAPADDAPEVVHLIARVDVEDPEDVARLVMDRMLEMQIEEGLPIFLIPLRSQARIAAMRAAQRPHSSARSEYLPAAI